LFAYKLSFFFFFFFFFGEKREKEGEDIEGFGKGIRL
jgi:hypothetical protein